MSSRKDRHEDSTYPEVPNSLHPDPYEKNTFRRTIFNRADTSPCVTPYLSLRSRLSQIWINRWTILLLLVLIRVVLLIAQLRENVGDAKAKALSACTKVEDVGSAMASMPHYLSVGVNDVTAMGIETAVHAMVQILSLILQGVEGMIIFFINFLTATYTCLITALIHGSLDVVAAVTKDASKALTDVVDKAAGDIETIAGGLEKAINKITKGIENSIFGNLIPDVPKIDFSKPVGNLKNFKLNPDDFVKDVQKLNKEIPTFDQVQNLTKQAVGFPFKIARDALNESYGSYKFKRDIFPLAQKQRLTFCSDNSKLNDFFQRIFDLISKARVAFIVVLSLLAVLVIIPMMFFEIHRWYRQQKHSKIIQNNNFDAMDVVYIASRPWTSRIGIKLSSRFKGKRQILVRWCVAYATSPPALLVLSLAITGFFSCFCQWILLKAIQKEVPALTQEVGAFAGEVVTSLKKVSQDWANDANGVIKGLDKEINGDVLIYVTNATDAVNNTLNVFLKEMDNGLNKVFKGTVLLDPIKSVLHCVIGIKIESVQKGLTWVHDNAHVNFPLLPADMFSSGANKSIGGDAELNTFLASPSSVSTDEVTGAVKHVVDWMHNNIVQEALISTGILLVYIIVVLIGVMRMIVGMATRERGRAEGGIRFEGPPDVVETRNEPPVEVRKPLSTKQNAAFGSRKYVSNEKGGGQYYAYEGNDRF